MYELISDYMKKLLLITLFSISYTLFAQNNAITLINPDPKEKQSNQFVAKSPWDRSYQQPAVKFGLKAGLNYSNMNFNKGFPAPEVPIKSSWKPGFVFGVLMEVPLYENFYIQPEYLFSQLEGGNTQSGVNYSMSYLSLPVLFKYKITSALALLAGPQFDLLIKAEQQGGSGDSNITHDTEERSIAAAAAIELNVFESLGFTAGFMHGFNHIGIGQRSAVKEFKYESATITATYKF